METRTLFKVVFLVGFVVAIAIRVAGVRRAGGERRVPEDRLERLVLGLNLIGMQVLPLIYVFTDWLDFADYALAAVWGWIGAALFGLGQVFIWRSHADLGRHWAVSTEIKAAHQLVTTGVYRHIRHPMYTGHLLWALGQPLLLWNWLAGFGYLAAALALMALRIPREEQMMRAHFGEDYRQYAARTGALLPRLRRER